MSTNGMGVRLGSPLADWWLWRGRGGLRRAATATPAAARVPARVREKRGNK
jgi:hypothetical protein